MLRFAAPSISSRICVILYLQGVLKTLLNNYTADPILYSICMYSCCELHRLQLQIEIYI